MYEWVVGGAGLILANLTFCSILPNFHSPCPIIKSLDASLDARNSPTHQDESSKTGLRTAKTSDTVHSATRHVAQRHPANGSLREQTQTSRARSIDFSLRNPPRLRPNNMTVKFGLQALLERSTRDGRWRAPQRPNTHARTQTGRQRVRQQTHQNGPVALAPVMTKPRHGTSDAHELVLAAVPWVAAARGQHPRQNMKSARTLNKMHHFPAATSAVPPGGTTPHPASCPSLAATCPSSTMPASACTRAVRRPTAYAASGGALLTSPLRPRRSPR